MTSPARFWLAIAQKPHLTVRQGITSLWPAHLHHLRQFVFLLSFPHLLCPDSPDKQRAFLSQWKVWGPIQLCPNSWEWSVKPAFPSASLLQDRSKASYSNAEAFMMGHPNLKFVSALESQRRTETELHKMRCFSKPMFVLSAISFHLYL